MKKSFGKDHYLHCKPYVKDTGKVDDRVKAVDAGGKMIHIIL
jgi:hypothetical protein